MAETDCHPGIYLAGLEYLRQVYDGEPLVKCWCFRDEIHHAGGKFRTPRLYSMGLVTTPGIVPIEEE